MEIRERMGCDTYWWFKISSKEVSYFKHMSLAFSTSKDEKVVSLIDQKLLQMLNIATLVHIFFFHAGRHQYNIVIGRNAFGIKRWFATLWTVLSHCKLYLMTKCLSDMIEEKGMRLCSGPIIKQDKCFGTQIFLNKAGLGDLGRCKDA